MSLHRPSRFSLSLASACAFALAATGTAGCAGHAASSEAIDAESAALVVDDQDTDDHEQTTELGIEEPLSGVSVAGGELDLTLDAPAAASAAKTNPGVFFQPAGCLTSTVAGNVVTHVFDDCTGPYGLVHLSGTVTSTWSKIAGGVEVVHQTTGFHIDGAVVDHTVTIDYTRLPAGTGVYTKTRHGTSSGTTKNGRAITHQADYVTTWDPASRCLTRNGSSDTTIGGAEFSRTITDYVRCGVGLGGCPKSGKYLLTRRARSIELDFPGGALVDVKIDGGATIERPLVCRPLA